MSEIDPQQFGRLQAEVEGLTAQVAELRADMKTLLETVANVRGGWKSIVLLASVAAAAGSLAHQAYLYFVSLH